MKEELAMFRLTRWEELPNIGLYLDQVLIVLEDVLKNIILEEKAVTATIINNYVKQKVIQPTVKKKYSREHISDIIMITVLKRVLSTAEIIIVLNELKEGREPKKAYDIFCSSIEEELQQAAGKAGTEAETKCPQLAEMAIRSAASKIAFDFLAADNSSKDGNKKKANKK